MSDDNEFNKMNTHLNNALLELENVNQNIYILFGRRDKQDNPLPAETNEQYLMRALLKIAAEAADKLSYHVKEAQHIVRLAEGMTERMENITFENRNLHDQLKDAKKEIARLKAGDEDTVLSQWVDAVNDWRVAQPPSSWNLSDNLPSHTEKLRPLLNELMAGVKINAVKEFRNLTGCSLTEAKTAVEYIMDRYNSKHNS